jgi:hypothetical protein
MRALTFATALAGLVIGSASANEAAPSSETVKVKLPSDLVAHLPAPLPPGNLRNAFEKRRSNQQK